MLSRSPRRMRGLETQSRKTRAVEIENNFANDAAAELATNLVESGHR